MPETPRRGRLCCAAWISAWILASTTALAAQPSVVGTVLGPSGRPVAGARAELVPVAGNFAAGRLRLGGQREPGAGATAASDAAGRFLLRAPASGVFKVVVRAEGLLPMQSPPLAVVGLEELPPVSLTADAGARVIVQDVAGRPLAGVWVFAESSGRRGRGQGAGGWMPDFRVGRTGGDGAITLGRRAGERLDVTVFPPGGAELRKLDVEGGTVAVPSGAPPSHRLRVVSLRGEPIPDILVRAGPLAWPVGLTDAEGRLRISVPPGETRRIWLVAADGRQQVVDPPAESSGEVTVVLAESAAVTGRILEQESARPLAGALVSPGLDPGAFLLTDAEGRYRLVAPNPHGFTLQVGAAHHLPRSARVSATHLRSGRAPTLALARGAALRGLAVDPAGAPLAGTTVTAFPDPGTAPGQATAVVSGASDGAGRFELRPLHTGTFYEIRAVRPGSLPASVDALVPAGEGAPLRIVLSPARSARGQVRDAAGRLLEGVEVRLTPAQSAGVRRPAGAPVEETAQGSPFIARTDAQGRFLIAEVPGERVDLTARRPGYATGRVRGIRVVPGTGPTELGTVVLQAGTPLAGRVVNRTGKPVPGAEVHLVDTVDQVERANAGRAGEEPDAVTRADGSFVLKDLPRGTALHLLVRAAGYLPAGVRGVRAPPAQPLTVRLEPAASLHGRVVDERDGPVAGARVALSWQASAPENPDRQTGAPVTRSGVSDRAGRFEIRDAPSGAVRLAVTAQGYVPLEGFEATVPLPEGVPELTLALERGAVLTGRVATAAGRPVADARIVAEGASVMSDDEGAYRVEGVPLGRIKVQAIHPAHRRFQGEMVVEPGLNPLDITLEEGVTVAGRVVDSAGAPIAGAGVALLLQAPRSWREYREPSDKDGAFRFSSVARGRYRLQAAGKGYATVELEPPVVVAEEPLGGLEVVLQRGGTITGRILGLNADELARVKVTAAGGGDELEATVDAGGRYEIQHLPPGDYLVRAAFELGQRQVQARVPLSGNEEASRDLEFTPRLALSGQVLYDEEPLPEAKISLRGQRLAVERTVWTDFEGAFRLEDLEPDTYDLGLSQSRELLVHNETLELTADRDHLIRLRPATVSGTVIDAQSGRPVPAALLTLRHSEGTEFLITDSARPDGTFSVHRVPAGGYQLSVRAAGYSPADRALTVQAGQELGGLEITLSPTRGLEVSVTLASGRVPDLVHLRVVSSAHAVILAETQRPDRSGKVTLSTLAEGSWTLFVGASGGATVAVPVTVPDEPLPVTLPAAGPLAIRVPALAATDIRALVTVSGAGASGQSFWTLGPGGALQDRWPLVGGRTVVEGVPAGLWNLRVEAPDGRVWTGAAAISGQGGTEIVLE